MALARSCRFRSQIALGTFSLLLLLLFWSRNSLPVSVPSFSHSDSAPAALVVPDLSFAFLRNPKFIVTFGDSYTSENWDGTSSPLDPYEITTACDGPVWARTLSRSIPGNRLVNLAVSGATIDSEIAHHEPWRPLDVKGQTKSFAKYLVPPPSEISWNGYNSLFVFEVGTNDVGMTYAGTPRMEKFNQTQADAHLEMMERYFTYVSDMYHLGARAFAFTLVGPFDRAVSGLQQGAKRQAMLKDAIISYNNALIRAAENYCTRKYEETNGDIFCLVYDAFNLTHHVMDHFADYSFKEPVKYCNAYRHRSKAEPDLDADPSCLGPVGVYVWRDHLHPSYRFHEIWAQDFKEKLLAHLPARREDDAQPGPDHSSGLIVDA